MSRDAVIRRIVALHVRSASAIRRPGSRLIVIQDDVNALAVMDASSCIMPLLLPPGADGRRSFDDTIGNKHLKMDLEAAVVLPDGRVLVFGSGSARARESIVVVESETGVRVRRAPGLYARLRKHCEIVGTELNIESVVIQGPRLGLFQRGNGARVIGGRSGSLVFDVDLAQLLRWLAGRGPVPNVTDVLEVDLGTIDGVPFGFTDAAVRLARRHGRARHGRDRVGWTCDSAQARRNRAATRIDQGVRCRGRHGSAGPSGLAG